MPGGKIKTNAHLIVLCLAASIWSVTPCDNILATAAAITSPTFLPPASSRAMYSCCALTYEKIKGYRFTGGLRIGLGLGRFSFFPSMFKFHTLVYEHTHKRTTAVEQ